MTGLNIVKTDIDKSDVVISYIELTDKGLITSTKRLYELNDEDLSITNKLSNKSYYFNNPDDYIKIFNTVNHIVRLNGSLDMLNKLLSRFVGEVVWLK